MYSPAAFAVVADLREEAVDGAAAVDEEAANPVDPAMVEEAAVPAASHLAGRPGMVRLLLLALKIRPLVLRQEYLL